MVRWKIASLGLLALLIPACGGNQTVSAPLFQETFSGTFPGTAWTAVTGTATAAISASIGNPQPALNFKTTTATSSASTSTVTAFAAPGVTFTVQEGVTMASAGLKGTGTISIVDSTPAVIAFVTWDPEVGQITYSILGSPLADPVAAPAADGSFHVFRFNIDSAGNATWSRDGLNKATHAAFPAGNLNLRLSATFGTGTAWPEFNFDNITISNP